jgi:hypothetical protein
MDLEVYRLTGDPDEPQQVATSGNPPGQAEQVVIQAPETGDYFARVVNYAAAPGTPYTLKVTRQTSGPDTITMSGKTEAWKMTCETPDGKVQETRDVTVWRGDVSTQDFACGQAAAVKGVKKAKKPSARSACLKRANRVKSKSKRRTAVKRCRAEYPAASKKKH